MEGLYPDKESMCHRTGFEKSCRELVSSGACKRWRIVEGEHPQTKAVLRKWDCIDNHLLVLQLDQTKKLLEMGAAIESFRNEVVDANNHFAAVFGGAIRKRENDLALAASAPKAIEATDVH